MPTSAAAEMEVLLAGLIEAGLSDVEIAERSGLARTTIAKIDSRQAGEPLLDTYMKLARAYQATLGRPPPPLSFDSRRR